jgi:hypothetical protein
MPASKPTEEQKRKARAVGQAHTAKEYMIHDAILADRPFISDEAAWRATMSLPPESRGRRPNRGRQP